MKRHETAYDDLLVQLNKPRQLSQHVFTTDATGLSKTWLRNLPEKDRQHYNCRACLDFIDKFGGLVTVGERGNTEPLLWDFTPKPWFEAAVEAVGVRVERANITGVFYHNSEVGGHPDNDGWHHMRCRGLPVRNNPEQAMAEKRQDFDMLSRALRETKPAALKEALTMLNYSSTMHSTDKFKPMAEWFMNALTRTHRGTATNSVWLEVASCQAGWAHFKNTMVGRLIELIENGTSNRGIVEEWNRLVDGLNYQRPKAEISEAMVAIAEQRVEKLGVTDSLRRRVASAVDVQTVWTPNKALRSTLFMGLVGKKLGGREFGETRMTWTKFERDYLPDAKSISVIVPRVGDFFCMTDQAIPGSKCIMKWGNNFSWYVYHGGSPSSQWGLETGAMVECVGIALHPSAWEAGKFNEKGVCFMLRGCKDKMSSGLALFPETLIGELRDIRKVIETYSNAGKLEPAWADPAAGLCLNQNPVNLKVTMKSGVVCTVTLDRLE